MNFKLLCKAGLLVFIPTAQHAGGMCCKTQSAPAPVPMIIISKQPKPQKNVKISPEIQIVYITPRVQHARVKHSAKKHHPQPAEQPSKEFWTQLIAGKLSFADTINKKT